MNTLFDTIVTALLTALTTMLVLCASASGYTLISLSAEQSISDNWAIGMSARLMEYEHNSLRYFTGATLYLDYKFMTGGAE